MWNPVLYRVGPSSSNLAPLHRLAYSFLAPFQEQWRNSGGTPLVLGSPLDLGVWLTLKMNACMGEPQMFVECVSTFSSVLNYSLSYFLREGLSLNPELTDSVELAGQQGLGSPCLCLSTTGTLGTAAIVGPVPICGS